MGGPRTTMSLALNLTCPWPLSWTVPCFRCLPTILPLVWTCSLHLPSNCFLFFIPAYLNDTYLALVLLVARDSAARLLKLIFNFSLLGPWCFRTCQCLLQTTGIYSALGIFSLFLAKPYRIPSEYLEYMARIVSSIKSNTNSNWIKS